MTNHNTKVCECRKYFRFYIIINGKVTNKGAMTTNLRTHPLACHPSKALEAKRRAEQSVQARLTAYDSASMGFCQKLIKMPSKDKRARCICKDVQGYPAHWEEKVSSNPYEWTAYLKFMFRVYQTQPDFNEVLWCKTCGTGYNYLRFILIPESQS